MVNVRIDELAGPTVADQSVEIVERKGIGHPDSICDGIMEYAAVRLAQAYRQRLGRVAHFNLDKGLLAAGSAERWFGGGRLIEPLRLVYGDRATFRCDGIDIPVDEIVRDAARAWLQAHVPRIDLNRDVVFQSELRCGSPELQSTASGPIGAAPANDSSAAVGYAPLTPTEQLVFAAERYLNSAEFKASFPDTGEDVKVMAFRTEGRVELTVAMPFLATCVTSEQHYFRRKDEAAWALRAQLKAQPWCPRAFDLQLNRLDAAGNDAAGVYLSYLGTSAEAGDSGEVGRGNRVNGLISLNRPSSAEAAAGKNPVSHVGKLYNVLAFQLARHIRDRVAGIRDVYVWLGSRIGEPVDTPALAAVQVALASGVSLSSVRQAIAEIVEVGVRDVGRLTEALIDGTVRIY